MDALKKAERDRAGRGASGSGGTGGTISKDPSAVARDAATDELTRHLNETQFDLPPTRSQSTKPAGALPTGAPGFGRSADRELTLQLPDDAAQSPTVPQSSTPAARPPTAYTPPSPPPMRGPASVARDEDARAAANVFEAKRRAAKPPSRVPFYAVMGALIVAALGVVGYFYTQMSGGVGGSLAGSGVGVSGSVGASPAAVPVTVAPAMPAPIPAPVAATTVEPTAALPPSVVAMPTTDTAIAPVSAPPVSAPVRAADIPDTTRIAPRAPVLGLPGNTSAVPIAPTAAVPTPVATPSAAPPNEIKITRTPVLATIHTGVEEGYAALLSGKLPEAETAYRRALSVDPGNRDALLGLAATVQRRGDAQQAQQAYGRLIELNPNDADAQAGLFALRQARSPDDQVRAESRLKTVIAQERQANAGIATASPTAAGAQFSLGAQLSAQGRWNEAQQAFFAAHTADPTNPDILFNLAVSLDQLGQRKLARDYYARAADSAKATAGRNAQFDPAAAQRRADQLSPSLETPVQSGSSGKAAESN